jgi:LacI family transcriptional regulator
LPTINDVAERAGVSTVTVSRVINNSGNVSAATREKVERAIDALGYVPSVAARSLRSKQTHTLALMVSDITNPFWTTVVRGVEDAAQSHDYSVFLYNTDEDPAKQERYLDVLLAQRVDGVIIAPYDSDARNLARLRKRNIPTVIIDRRIEGEEMDSVYCDSVAGGRALIQHLISLGHKRIAMLSGPANTTTSQDRIAGYRAALTEAGIPIDSRLIREGEYRAGSGRELAHQVLDEELEPTAICAANNVIAMGVIEALGERGLRIPHDIALVCFDELPNVSRVLPFLTVVVQPAYDMGVNAAQLLLSRLDSEKALKPRHVVLPTRLLVRYSCGSRLGKAEEDGSCLPCLPFFPDMEPESKLVRPLDPEGGIGTSTSADGAIGEPAEERLPADTCDKPDVNRLQQALQHREADRVPYLELQVTSKSICEYVLGRELGSYASSQQADGWAITPQDHVALAVRLGMDAVPCHFSWRPCESAVETQADLDDLKPPPALADQLSHLERYLRAAQGTGVGVFADLTSFFDTSMSAVGLNEALYVLHENRTLLERMMDVFSAHQAKVMRAVCDRFGDDLAFVMVSDNVAHDVGPMMPSSLFVELFSARMERLIAPAKEHGKLVALHTDGRVNRVLAILYDVGFDILHPLVPEYNDIFEIKKEWAGKIALMGNVPVALLTYGSKEEIEDRVRDYCARLAPGGGYVLSSSKGIVDGIPPESFVAMTEAARKYGRYGFVGEEA